MKDYLVLIRGGDARMADLTEAETAAHMERWNVFMGGLAQSGNLAGGLPLGQDGRVLTTAGSSEGVVNSENGQAIGGYLMIKAENYDQAVELSKACPVFEHNGNLEIRECIPM